MLDYSAEPNDVATPLRMSYRHKYCSNPGGIAEYFQFSRAATATRTAARNVRSDVAFLSPE